MKASILAVGTELTIGQILNKNAQWISAKVYQHGIPISCHLTVADDHSEILQGLNYCKDRSEILFVTGGLGPTSDDFTRDVIAKWCGLDLAFDEPSWHHIVDRLQARNIPVRESQRQQCFFPVGSKILKNEMGTANAFAITFAGLRIFVLPGPPREVEAVWPEIKKELIDFSKNLDPLITKSWDTLGQGESEIAFLIEPALAGCEFEVGYRAHLPFVEVKLTFLKSQSDRAMKFIQAIENALKEWIVSRDGSDSATMLALKFELFSTVSIVDSVSGSYLINRLMPHMRNFLNHKKFTYAQDLGSHFNSELQLELVFEGANNKQAKVRFKNKNTNTTKELLLEAPRFYQSDLMIERARQYFAEIALLHWHKLLGH